LFFLFFSPFKVDEPENNAEELLLKTSKCVWCSQHLTLADAPKLLECLHVTCGACIKQKVSESVHPAGLNIVQCPICKMDNRYEFIIEHQFLIELINSGGDDSSQNSVESTKDLIKCSSCSDEATATSWCVECSEFICDNCVQAHQRLKITKDHTIKGKDAAVIDNQVTTNTSRNIMCQMHPQVSDIFGIFICKYFISLITKFFHLRRDL
jgi:tripartite motif-containing protein 33